MKKNDLKTKLKKAKKVYIWSPESESKKESKIKLNTKLKKAKKVYIWSPESESKMESKKKDVFITRNEFSEIIPKILDEVGAYFTLNKNNIIQARMDKDDKGFYEHLKFNGYTYINDQTDLLKNLTKKQTQTVFKLILATYLILNKKELKPRDVQKIAGLTRWMTDLIRKHFNLYGLRSVKSLKESLKNNFRQITIEVLKSQTQKCPDSKLILTISIKIFDDALSKPNGLIADDLPLGFKLKLEYLAGSLVFYALNHSDFTEQHPKYELYTVTEYIRDFYPNNTTWRLAIQNIVPLLYDFLSDSLKLKLSYFPIRSHKVDEEVKEKVIKLREQKIPIHTKKRDFRDIVNDLRNLFKLFNIHDPEEYLKTAKAIYETAIKNGFDLTKIQKFKQKQLLCFSVTLLYYSLLKKGHKSNDKKEIWNKLKKTKYHIGQNSFSRISQDFGNYIDIRGYTKYDRRSFEKKLQEIKEQYEKNHRHDNVALIDLLLKTLDLYKSNFKDFINKIAFIGSMKAKASKIIERLIIPNNFNKISILNDFVSKYKMFIDKSLTNSNDKNKLNLILEKFRISKEEFYRFEEKKTEKKRREQVRYSKYGDAFYSMENRIKRFLLMLGFSPYDGFDIWENKVLVNGKYYIFANFHHFHYDPEDQSNDDLVFIPVKPPKEYRKKEMNSLTHNMIAGREGNLKRSDISKSIRQNIIKELKMIEERINFNSSLLERAVFVFNPNILNDLKGWAKKSINKAKKRLKENFKWAKGIEECIPTAKGYEYERFTASETKKIIQDIIGQRESGNFNS